MTRAQVWKRLLWKEFREGWPVVLAASALPALLLPQVRRFPSYGWQRDGLLIAAVVGAGLAIVFWAAGKAGRKKPGAEFAASNLPVNRGLEWATSFLFPMLLVAALGVWFGFLSFRYAPMVNACKPFMWRHTLGENELTWGYLFAAVFGACYYLSLLTSTWLATVAGIIMTLWGLTALEALWNNYTSLAELEGQVRHGAGITAAAAAGTLLLALARRKPSRVRQVASLAVVLALVAGFYYVDVKPGGNWWKHAEVDLDPGSSSTEDNSFQVSSYEETDPVMLHYQDYRSENSGRRLFPQVVKVLDVLDDRRAYIAQQAKGKEQVEILVWDTKRDTLRRLAPVPCGKDALRRTWEVWNGWSLSAVSPDGRYLLLALQSRVGDDTDLWVVDLTDGRASLALANDSFPQERVSWIVNRAILSWESGPALVVNLKRATARPLRLHGRGG